MERRERQSKHTLNMCRREEERMGERIWSQLLQVEYLLVMILLRLPVPKLLQFRIVCKEWKRLIDCSYFSKSRSEVSSAIKTNFIVLDVGTTHPNAYWVRLHPFNSFRKALHIRVVHVYNPVLNTWYHWPPSMITDGDNFLQSYHMNMWCVGRKRLHPKAKWALVGDPTSRSMREMPIDLDSVDQNWPLSLIVEEGTSNFMLISVVTGCSKVHCPCKGELCLHTQLFDSVSNQWREAEKFLLTGTQFNLSQDIQAIQIVVGHRVYYMFCTSKPSESVGEADSFPSFSEYSLVYWDGTILSFDCNEKKWRVLVGNTPFRRAIRSNIRLCERNGSVVLIALTFTDDDEWRLFLGWKPRIYSWDPSLSPDSPTWAEIEVSVPPKDEEVRKLFCRQRGKRFKGSWTGHGDHLIFLSSVNWGHRALLYNISTKTWTVTIFGPERRTGNQNFLPVPYSFCLQKL